MVAYVATVSSGSNTARGMPTAYLSDKSEGRMGTDSSSEPVGLKILPFTEGLSLIKPATPMQTAKAKNTRKNTTIFAALLECELDDPLRTDVCFHS